jgi:hypothetical protein
MRFLAGVTMSYCVVIVEGGRFDVLSRLAMLVCSFTLG